MIYTIVYNRYDIPRFNCLCVRPFFAVQQRNSASFRFKLQCLLDPAVAQFLNFLFPVCKSSFIWMRLNTPRGALVPLVETKWEAYCWNSWGKACGGGVGRTLKTWKPQKLRLKENLYTDIEGDEGGNCWRHELSSGMCRSQQLGDLKLNPFLSATYCITVFIPAITWCLLFLGGTFSHCSSQNWLKWNELFHKNIKNPQQIRIIFPWMNFRMVMNGVSVLRLGKLQWANFRVISGRISTGGLQTEFAGAHVPMVNSGKRLHNYAHHHF